MSMLTAGESSGRRPRPRDAGFTEPIQAFVEQGLILQSEPTCDRPAPSWIPKRYTYPAAWAHLVRWVRDGTPPPGP
jgi:hypothetical protein